MCFSAPASFIASGGLAVVGGASFAVAKKEDKILALIPVLFAIQQGSEGVQWLYLNAGSSSLPAAYIFLFFAFIIWPIYVPVFVYRLDPKKRHIVKWFVGLGIAVALYFLGIFLTQALSVHEFRECIGYSFNFPLKAPVNAAYLLAVFVPLFISSKHIFKWFGVIIAFLAIITWIIFDVVVFASVWCFFAAIVSSMFFVYIKFKKRA